MPGLGDWLAQILDLGQGAQGRDLNRASTAADIADPFRGERGKFWPLLEGLLGGTPPTQNQQQLNLLLQEPGNFKMDPGAQFAMEQGLQGVARYGNSMFGTTRSGNTAVELDKYGTGFAGAEYSKRIDQLMGISREDNRSKEAWINELMGVSGANTGSPAAAAQAYLGGFANQDRRLASGLSGGLLDNIFGLLGKGAGGLMDFFKGLGGSGIDFSGLNLTGSADDFLRSIGLDPSNVGGDFGIDSDIWSRFQNIFGGGDGTGGPGGADFDWGNVSDSTGRILDDIFSGGMP